MQKVFRFAIHALTAVTFLLPLGAQDTGITKQQADEIINELKQIRQLPDFAGFFDARFVDDMAKGELILHVASLQDRLDGFGSRRRRSKLA